MTMNMVLRKTALCFSAGCIGGFANSVLAWIVGGIGITAALGVSIAPSLTTAWLYPRIVWGGLWGLLFLLPYLKGLPYVRGLLWSLGPTIVQLFIVFPIAENKGILGLELGLLTPLTVLMCNAVWGLMAALVLERINGD